MTVKTTVLCLLALVGVATAAEQEAPKPEKPSDLFIGHPTGYMEPELAREPTAEGFIVDHSSWSGVTQERLRRFNTVVL